MDPNANTSPDETPLEDEQAHLNPGKLSEIRDRLLRDQNLPLGVMAGLAAAILGAALWAGVTVATEFQIGWMAIGVGFLVGFGVRALGKGVTNVFGIVGGGFAFIGCLMGNVLSACGFVSIQQSAPFLDVTLAILSQPAVVVEVLQVGFSPMDLLFYGLAVYAGYRYSFRQLTQSDLARLEATA